jgi:hypothetical protein
MTGIRSRAEGLFVEETGSRRGNVLMKFEKSNSDSLHYIVQVCGSSTGVSDLGTAIHVRTLIDLGQTSVTAKH